MQGKLSEISSERTYGIHKYFQETTKATFCPRSLLIDLEPSTLDQVRGRADGQLYRPDQYVFDQVGSGNIYARGYYGEGAELVERAIEAVRKQTETCDCLQGFQFTHSIGGGTGSGLGSLLISRIREEYTYSISCSYTVVPSTAVSDIVTEPYNAVLAFHSMTEPQDMCILFDNEAIYGLTHLEVDRPTYRDINQYIATAINGVTSPIRFSGSLNSNYRKLGVNVVPYPRYHFLSVSTTQLCRTPLTVPQAVDWALHPAHSLSSLPAPDYVIVALAAIFRGEISFGEADKALVSSLAIRNQFMCKWWFSDLISTSISSFPSKNSPISLTLLMNSPIISLVFKRLLGQFDKLFGKKAFLHRYLTEGMEEAEFVEAASNVRDLYYEQGEGKTNCFCGNCDSQGRAIVEEED